jgi:hypothetical protein
MVICQYWSDGECMNAWDVETNVERVAILAKLSQDDRYSGEGVGK